MNGSTTIEEGKGPSKLEGDSNAAKLIDDPDAAPELQYFSLYK
jgi:hypothetical protein